MDPIQVNTAKQGIDRLRYLRKTFKFLCFEPAGAGKCCCKTT